MTVTVYTDASHCQDTKVAACGYCILVEDEMIKHEIILASNIASSGAAEIFAAILGVQQAYLVKTVSTIKLYTDYNTILTSKRKKQRVASMFEEYDDTLAMLKEDGIKFHAIHVRGHNGDKYNGLVDQSCRTALRKILNNGKSIKKVKPKRKTRAKTPPKGYHLIRRNDRGIPFAKQ